MARTRYKTPDVAIPLRDLPAAALRAVLREGYRASDLRADVMAGLVVGVVALPLSMALAIGAGVPPQHGLYTAIVAGLVVAALGGSRTQVTGPTAAFIVILAPIAAKFGVAGLLVAGLMAGVMLLGMGLLRLGRLIEFIPHPVTTGFTAGIGVVIATLQLKDFFGLTLARTPDGWLDRVVEMIAARGTASAWEPVIGLGTLAILVFLPKLTRRVPAPLVALPLAAIAAWALGRVVPGFHVATIASRFHTQVGDAVVDGIPRLPPLPLLPWNVPAADGTTLTLSFATVRALLPGAFAIALLGAIESLLSAVVSDGMARTRHDPDAELLALGVGNVLCPFFGGIAATGAIARTATGIRSGSRSPIASMAHALTVLAAVLVLAPLLGWLPMTSLAALLLLVAWNMSDAKHFVHVVRVAPRSDVAVLLVCFGLTVSFDMVIGVSTGVVLAALIFMRRMADMTRARITLEHPIARTALPEGVSIYEISGPLFFGAARKAMATLGVMGDRSRALILDMSGVGMMDVTGLVALESALDELKTHKCLAVLSGVQPQPRELLERVGLGRREGVVLCSDPQEALAAATAHAAGTAAAATAERRPVHA